MREYCFVSSFPCFNPFCADVGHFSLAWDVLLLAIHAFQSEAWGVMEL